MTAWRIRCPRARRPTDPEHIVRDLPYPVPLKDHAAHVKQLGGNCPCGARLVILFDDGAEPWEPGWQDEPMDGSEEDEDDQTDDQTDDRGPRPELPPLPPEVLEVLAASEDPTLRLVVAHLREERHRAVCAEANDAKARDILRVLVRAVSQNLPEAHTIARELLGESTPDMHLRGLSKTSAGAAQVRISAHWAAWAFAESFGRSLGNAINYVEMPFQQLDGARVIVTIQREAGKSPHTLRAEAEQARDRLASTLQSVQGDLNALADDLERIVTEGKDVDDSVLVAGLLHLAERLGRVSRGETP